MTDHRKNLPKLSPTIRGLLSQLRSRIRFFVLLEGTGWAIAGVIAMFAIAFGLDYLPVRFGYSELGFATRVVLLAMTGTALIGILFHYVLRRIFVPLKDRSLALLVERQYPEFSDCLVTTVEQSDPLFERINDDVPVDRKMLEQTRLKAESLVPQVDTAKVVSFKPARWAMMVAGVLLLGLIGAVAANPPALQLAAERLYLLSEKVWPRQCQVELVGLVVKRETTVAGISEFEQTVVLQDGVLRVARGSTVTMLVKAEQSSDRTKKLPETCWLNYYRTTEGTRGSQPFKRIGSPRNGFQTYVLDGAPLENMISGLEFTILGGDNRIGPYRLDVVDEPVVKSTDLACQFPDYMVDENTGRFTDRTIRWTGEAKLPLGTEVTLKMVTQAPVAKVYVQTVSENSVSDTTTESMDSFKVSGNTFSYPLASLRSTQQLRFYLCDPNGIVSETPHEVLVEPVKDTAPSVSTVLKGIGTAVTPDVLLPISASIEDDYGIDKAWIELEIGATNVIENEATLSKSGKLEAAIDFRQRRIEKGDTFRLSDDGESKLSIVVAATDKFNLGETPNVGMGQRVDLDVVSPAEMLRILERLEVGQRRRLEQVAIELNDIRKYLERTRSRSQSEEGIVEPGDEPESDAEDSLVDEAQRLRQEREMRRLFAQRSLLQIEKSTQEIKGSANAFEDLKLQLINNRIVGTNREQRFEEQIIGPLNEISDDTLNRLKNATLALEETLKRIERGELSLEDNGLPNPLTDQDVEKLEQLAAETNVDATTIATEAIDQLNAVLDLLIKFETQNELLDIVRQMIAEQKAIIERTKKQGQKQAFEGLLD